MNFLTGDEERQALEFINQAVICAKKSTCKKARCGSVIVYSQEIIGSGFNSPPAEIEE